MWRQYVIRKIQYCGLLHHSKVEQILNVLSTRKKDTWALLRYIFWAVFPDKKPYRERGNIPIQRLY